MTWANTKSEYRPDFCRLPYGIPYEFTNRDKKQTRDKVMRDLEEYCGRDTEGMIWIVERLRGLGTGDLGLGLGDRE